MSTGEEEEAAAVTATAPGAEARVDGADFWADRWISWSMASRCIIPRLVLVVLVDTEARIVELLLAEEEEEEAVTTTAPSAEAGTDGADICADARIR